MKELEHAGEAHGVKRLGGCVTRDFELHEVCRGIQVLPGEWTLASHAKLLGDERFLKDMAERWNINGLGLFFSKEGGAAS